MDITIAGYRAGRAAAFFGVDERSTIATQYLTSGLRWRISDSSLKMVQVSVQRTEARGVINDDEFETHLVSRFDPGKAWFMPTLIAEFEHQQVFDVGQNGGNTISFGVTDGIGPGRFGMRMFRTDATGTLPVWGSDFASRGVVLEAKLQWPNVFHLSSRMVAREPVTRVGKSNFGQRLSLAGPAGLIVPGGRWRLQVRYGTGLSGDDKELQPLDLDLKLAHISFSGLNMTTAIGWHRNNIVDDYALPIAGAMGRLRLEKVFTLGGFAARFMPAVTFGQSCLPKRDWTTRAGLTLQLSRARNHLDFSMAYVSSDWHTAEADSGLTTMLQFTHAGIFRVAGL